MVAYRGFIPDAEMTVADGTGAVFSVTSLFDPNPKKKGLRDEAVHRNHDRWIQHDLKRTSHKVSERHEPRLSCRVVSRHVQPVQSLSQWPVLQLPKHRRGSAFQPPQSDL